MGYQVGGLDLPITANSFSAVDEIDKVINKLTRLQTVLDNFSSVKLSSSQMQSNANAISSFIDKINTSSTAGITAFSRFSSTINKVDYDKAVGGFEKLTTAIKPFLTYVQQSTKGLLALDSVLTKVSGKKLAGLSKVAQNNKGGMFGSLFSLAKFGTLIHSFKRLGGFMGDLLQAGSDYAESLNMWQVSMRGNLDLADKFVAKMNKAYGISEKTLMTTQATFKNMIGSLGQITDDVAYELSEALTLMAVDYSSLYNVQMNKAFEKFQAMLAGQVRPIRSVSGLDITETTLFQLYQSIGGTKSMRQLTRTEKQLLSILSVYKQMGRAGALGDMTKTLDQFANQSRMMTEYWAQLKAWTGLVLKDLIQDWGVLVKINALLITASEVVRAIAKSRGADQENFLDGLYETAQDTNKEIDELQGKLLDFDKFRSLQDSGAGDVQIDQALLDALTGYSSNIDYANNQAQELAEEWLSILGFTRDENGELVITEGNLKNILDVFEDIKDVAIAISIVSIVTGFKKLATVSVSLSNILLTGVVFAIIKAVEAFKDGDKLAGAMAITVGVGLVGAMIAFKTVLIDGKLYLDLFGKTLNSTFIAPLAGIALLTAGIMSLVDAWGDMGGWQKAITIISAVAGAIVGAVVAVKAFSLSIPVAIGLGTALAGAILLIGSQVTKGFDIPKFANGGTPDKGSLFYAGEAGAEIVYNTPSGQSGVVNISQIKEATRQGTLEALRNWWGGAREDIPQLEGVDDVGVYKLATSGAGKFGKGWSNK